MSTLSFWTSRRRLLGAAATAGLVGLMPAALRAAPAGDAIRPFRVNVPHADLDDLRRRVLATRWVERSYHKLIYFNEATRAATSRRGKSRNSSAPRSGRPSLQISALRTHRFSGRSAG